MNLFQESGYYIQLNRIGEVFFPGKYTDVFEDGKTVKFFSEKDLQGYNQVLKHIKQGGIVVVAQEWEKVLQLQNEIERKKKELIGEPKSKTAREWNSIYQNITNRLMVMVENGVIKVEPPISFPCLFNFLGETTDGAKENLFLISVNDYLRMKESWEEKHFIKAIDDYVNVHYNVLAPKSQETISLIKKGFEEASLSLPNQAKILDMGCGSGIISILAALVFKEKEVAITATDHLIEAIATAKLNIQRFEASGKIPPKMISTTEGGDLFQPVVGQSYDLIIFNAPWVVAKAKNRAETALNDEAQNAILRFIKESKNFLNKNGHVMIGYANHSGQKAIDTIENAISENGYRIVNVYKDKIQTRREVRKWETVYLFDFAEK